MPRSTTGSWTAKQCLRKINSGEFNFDNAVQRGLTWDVKRASLMIHTMILGWVKTQPINAKRTETGYDIIEGKQRLLKAVKGYIEDGFALKNIPDTDPENEPFYDLNDKLVTAESLEGKKFSELTEEQQDAILDYTFQFYIYDGISDGQNEELFIRVNNGKGLTATDITRVKTISKREIADMASHTVFNSILTEKSINSRSNETITHQIYVLMYNPVPSFDTNKLRPFITKEIINQDQIDFIKHDIFDMAQSVIDVLNSRSQSEDTPEDEKDKLTKVFKRMKVRTHFVALSYVFAKASELGLTADQVADWCIHFFNNGTGSTTISDAYNRNSYAGSSDNNAITIRKEQMLNDFSDMFHCSPDFECKAVAKDTEDEETASEEETA